MEKMERLIKSIDFALINKAVHFVVKLKKITLDWDNLYKAVNNEPAVKAIHDSDTAELRRWLNWKKYLWSYH